MTNSATHSPDPIHHSHDQKETKNERARERRTSSQHFTKPKSTTLTTTGFSLANLTHGGGARRTRRTAHHRSIARRIRIDRACSARTGTHRGTPRVIASTTHLTHSRRRTGRVRVQRARPARRRPSSVTASDVPCRARGAARVRSRVAAVRTQWAASAQHAATAQGRSAAQITRRTHRWRRRRDTAQSRVIKVFANGTRHYSK